jgi:hypothetical protein
MRAAAAALLIICSSFLVEAQPVYRAGVDLTTFGATITDKKGNIVTDLTRDDFEIVEDGKPQSIQYFANVGLAMLGALAVAVITPKPHRFDRVRTALMLVLFGGLLAPALTSILMAAFFKLTGISSEMWLIVVARTVTNTFAVVTLVPLIVHCAERLRSGQRPMDPTWSHFCQYVRWERAWSDRHKSTAARPARRAWRASRRTRSRGEPASAAANESCWCLPGRFEAVGSATRLARRAPRSSAMPRS